MIIHCTEKVWCSLVVVGSCCPILVSPPPSVPTPQPRHALPCSSWMMAADYFMSARARGLRIPPSLDALGTATIRHLAWRFGRFYRDEEMMRIMVG